MSFDSLAPHYRRMEWILAGSKLQKCRTAFLHDIPQPSRVLLAGEGNGRLLLELCRAFPEVQVTCVDSSARMLDCARAVLAANGINTEAVEFVHADILKWSAPPDQFDLIVTHFFLDCFNATQLVQVVSRLAACSTLDGVWLLADFHQPTSGLAKWRARWILKGMYLYFRWITGLSASHLVDPDLFLKQHGFVLQRRYFSEWRLLHTDAWSRAPLGRDKSPRN